MIVQGSDALFGLPGLTDLETRHKDKSESEWCEAHHVRNPNANDYLQGHPGWPAPGLDDTCLS